MKLLSLLSFPPSQANHRPQHPDVSGQFISNNTQKFKMGISRQALLETRRPKPGLGLRLLTMFGFGLCSVDTNQRCTQYIQRCFMTNLFPSSILVVFACTCFGLQSRPSSGSYKPFGCIQRIWQLVCVCVCVYANGRLGS
jgi:hypothetical protein